MGRRVADMQVEQLGPPVGVVQRRALASRVRQPHRQVVGPEQQQLLRRGVADQSPDPIDEQATGVAGPANGHEAGPGRGERPQAVDLDPLVREHKRQQGRAAHHQHVADLTAGGHQLLAQRVDGAGRHQGTVSLANGRCPRADGGELIGGHADLLEQVRRPTLPVGHRGHSHGSGGVDGDHAAQGTVGHGLCRPEGVHAATPGQPASESDRVPLGRPLAGIGSGDGAGVRPTMVRPAIGICPSARAACGGAAPSVAIEQARGDGHPCRVDPAHGRHHGRDGDRSDRSSRGARSHVVPGGQHAVNPRLPGVVFEPAGIGGHHPMRDPGPRQDVAVIVGRDRLHRGRPDVDPDRHVAHAPSHGHLLQPPPRSLTGSYADKGPGARPMRNPHRC